MALSFAQYLGDGVTRLFPVPFEYLNKAHVSVTVNGDPAVPVWEGNQAVRLSSAPATDAVVEVARNTPGDTRLVDFVDGSVLTERDLDLSALQLLFIAQEASDRASRSLGLTPSGKFDARGLEIINAGSPSAPTSVATRQWTEDAIEGAIEPVASKTTFFFVEKSPEASAVSKDQMDAADRATLEASNGYADEKLGTVAAELAKKLNKCPPSALLRQIEGLHERR
ncbi:phage tail fiber domain-containing protein, partial [Methylorubrum thiocyanatum]|uniref:phage tail fiber domain-containing protein n=1 Tax=Methylorubrum thiocyanatum TaxID=47958 RepID=UPI0035C84592